MSLSSFIRSLLAEACGGVAEPERKHMRRERRPTQKARDTAQALAILGASRVPNNINQIAKAINEGRYPVSPDAEAELLGELQSVKGLLSEIRTLLMTPPGRSGSV